MNKNEYWAFLRYFLAFPYLSLQILLWLENHKIMTDFGIVVQLWLGKCSQNFLIFGGKKLRLLLYKIAKELLQYLYLGQSYSWLLFCTHYWSHCRIILPVALPPVLSRADHCQIWPKLANWLWPNSSDISVLHWSFL